MPWRGIFVVTVGLLTSGCILSAYQVASWTVTGVSYVFSGKGLGDHVLSLATSKDCATLRILQAKQICVDYGSGFENGWTALASSWKVPDLLRQPANDAKDVEPPAVLAAFGADAKDVEPPIVLTASSVDTPAFSEPADDTPEIQSVALTVPFDAAPHGTPAVRSGLDFEGLVALQARVDEADLEVAWLASAGSTPGMDFGGLTPSDGALVPVTRKKIAAPALRIVKSVAAVTPGRPTIYLVLGSFRDRANADALRASHAGRNTLVMKILADDRAMFRVLAGPIAATLLSEARVDIARAGFRNAWAVKLCSGSLAPPPCEPVLQQASLPER